MRRLALLLGLGGEMTANQGRCAVKKFLLFLPALCFLFLWVDMAQAAIDAATRQRIILVRQAMEIYRTKHAALYTQNLTPKQLADAHVALLNEIKVEAIARGFTNVDQFFDLENQLKAEGF